MKNNSHEQLSMRKQFRDCNCGHTKDHHSQSSKSKRCLNHYCSCEWYVPKGAIREKKTEIPKVNDNPEKFKFERDMEQGRKVWYVVEKPASVIATCYGKKDAERITNLLNFIEKVNVLEEYGTKKLKELLV